MANECVFLMDVIVDELAEGGLVLNLNQAIVLTNETQPPIFFEQGAGDNIKSKMGWMDNDGHKWLLFFVLRTSWSN